MRSARRHVLRHDAFYGTGSALGVDSLASIVPEVRRAWLRAAGGHIGRVVIARSATFEIPALLELQDGVQIGSFACLCPVVEPWPSGLLIDRIVVERGAFVGAYGFLGAGVRVGRETILGAEVRLLPGSSIGSRTRVRGALTMAPGASVGDDCRIGFHVKIHDGATVQDGARLGHHVVVHPNATVPAGSRVPDHAVVPSGSTWSDAASSSATRAHREDGTP